uniref:Twinfilin actin-binding protein 2a n=1 Tax=Hucho hucho TaxID=62062 RepID=A0A4W5LGI2_9TELE
MFLVLIVTPELREFLARARGGAIRLIQVRLQDKQLVLGTFREPGQKFPGIRVPRDKRQGSLIHPVRQKMLYSATIATVKKEFGGGHVKDEMFGTAEEDICLEGYQRHVSTSSGPAPPPHIPLSNNVLCLCICCPHQVKTETSVESKSQTLQGLTFPLQEDAKRVLQQLAQKHINYIQLKLDTEKEMIELVHSDPTEAYELPCRVPTDTPRYHFFLYKHSHEGDYLEYCCIYSMRGYSCSIKERMLYSSCKSRLLDEVEKDYHLEVAKKMEIDNGDELTEEFLYDVVHPKQHAFQQAFAKPCGPTGKRGSKRLIKGPAAGEGRLES